MYKTKVIVLNAKLYHIEKMDFHTSQFPEMVSGLNKIFRSNLRLLQEYGRQLSLEISLAQEDPNIQCYLLVENASGNNEHLRGTWRDDCDDSWYKVDIHDTLNHGVSRLDYDFAPESSAQIALDQGRDSTRSEQIASNPTIILQFSNKVPQGVVSQIYNAYVDVTDIYVLGENINKPDYALANDYVYVSPDLQSVYQNAFDTCDRKFIIYTDTPEKFGKLRPDKYLVVYWTENGWYYRNPVEISKLPMVSIVCGPYKSGKTWFCQHLQTQVLVDYKSHILSANDPNLRDKYYALKDNTHEHLIIDDVTDRVIYDKVKTILDDVRYDLYTTMTPDKSGASVNAFSMYNYMKTTEWTEADCRLFLQNIGKQIFLLTEITECAKPVYEYPLVKVSRKNSSLQKMFEAGRAVSLKLKVLVSVRENLVPIRRVIPEASSFWHEVNVPEKFSPGPIIDGENLFIPRYYDPHGKMIQNDNGAGVESIGVLGTAIIWV